MRMTTELSTWRAALGFTILLGLGCYPARASEPNEYTWTILTHYQVTTSETHEQVVTPAK